MAKFAPLYVGQHAAFESYGKKPAYFDPDQLYDLDADPDEMVNLANDPRFQEVLESMKAIFQQHLSNLPGTFGEFKTSDELDDRY